MAASPSAALLHGVNLGSEYVSKQEEVEQCEADTFTPLNELEESISSMQRISHQLRPQLPLIAANTTNSVLPAPRIPIPLSRTEATAERLKNVTSVDSALLSAMRDDRERVAVLRCEQTMIDFIKATEIQEMDVGGPYNSTIVGLPSQPPKQGQGRQTSFQRCWLHRLADRFGIVRESISPEWIRCKKTPDSAIPSQLLIDLEPADYGLSEHNTTQLMATSNISGTGNKIKRKMKIMKRSASTGATNSENGNNKTSRNIMKRGTLTDKEKKYAEARARIFNGGNPSAETDISRKLVIPPTPKSEDEFRPAAATFRPAAATFRPAAATMGGISKVTWRNRQQEENDPDFQRGVMYAAPGQQQQQQPYAGYYSQQQQQFYYDQHYYGQQQTHYFGAAQENGRGRGRMQGQEDFPA
mmetsp:Transcript_42380/g.48139  ORF Transcript_42380/g.48139 Transcript_42380/m.48139 type:complete len:413 (+) Transcript_42380:179-1417(+)|eukprot:CAMPEP_0194146702 /NCGR_PEP_ID=MMETSP0152-20130528/21373_1 /TAXON_ID=1049557 /ORGANISM="Thalassiothrix antarctica, Strain L6-D1" /LENGTH=412 /DNA_ID=CAMNT_0038847281 /DNA_START=160 /DNA_END=1398 /DNA_ORIENTATION=+